MIGKRGRSVLFPKSLRKKLEEKVIILRDAPRSMNNGILDD